MSILSALAAGVLMTPAHVATDVSQQIAHSSPEYDWKAQKAIVETDAEIEGPRKMASATGTQSFVGQTWAIDDMRTWD